MMLPILQFVFSGFWIWLGSAILLSIAVAGVSQVLAAVIHAIGRRS
jgi:hypothetical protein